MSNNDVIEATAALKGMLGIGGVGRQSPASTTDDAAKHKPKKYASTNPGTNREPRPSTKKKKTKKKKNNSFSPHNNSNLATSGSSGASGDYASAVSKPQNNIQNQQQGNKKNNKTKKIPYDQLLSPPNTKSKGKKKENSNFAWSAFQSPPDASSLPLPAFSGADLFSNTRISPEKGQQEQEERARNVSFPRDVVPKSAEQFENEVIAAAEAAAESKTNQEYKQTHVEDDELVLKSQIVADEPKSQSGVNLAAFASTPQKEVSPPVKEDAFLSLLNKSKAKQQATSITQTQPHHLYNNGFSQSQQQQHQQQHFPHQQQIITIQVQVPPVLLAGRQMMVHTPAGYPIPVVVPENIRPGMVIPVNVPAPLNFHPHLAQMGGHPQQHLMQQHPHQQQQPPTNLPPSPMNQFQYSNFNATQHQPHHRAPHLAPYSPNHDLSSPSKITQVLPENDNPTKKS